MVQNLEWICCASASFSLYSVASTGGFDAAKTFWAYKISEFEIHKWPGIRKQVNRSETKVSDKAPYSGQKGLASTSLIVRVRDEKREK